MPTSGRPTNVLFSRGLAPEADEQLLLGPLHFRRRRRVALRSRPLLQFPDGKPPCGISTFLATAARSPTASRTVGTLVSPCPWRRSPPPVLRRADGSSSRG